MFANSAIVVFGALRAKIDSKFLCLIYNGTFFYDSDVQNSLNRSRRYIPK